jgi:hypothetical protein
MYTEVYYHLVEYTSTVWWRAATHLRYNTIADNVESIKCYNLPTTAPNEKPIEHELIPDTCDENIKSIWSLESCVMYLPYPKSEYVQNELFSDCKSATKAL